MSKIGQKRTGDPSVLEIHLLGPFRIAVDGRAVEERRFTRRKPKLLVKLLALQPHHRLHREQLVELLRRRRGRGAPARPSNPSPSCRSPTGIQAGRQDA